MAGKFPAHERGYLPNELNCVDAYDLTDFVLSPRADDLSDEPDLRLLRRVTKNADPKVAVGPRGFRPNYAKALFRGRFTDCEAKAAFGNFESLGKRYLNCSMPPWL